MRHIIWVFWPAFIAAGIAEIVFFTVIDPRQLYLFGKAVELSSIATYSIGFMLFWLICSCSSLLTWFMLPEDIKRLLEEIAKDRSYLSRSARPNHARPNHQ